MYRTFEFTTQVQGEHRYGKGLFGKPTGFFAIRSLDGFYLLVLIGPLAEIHRMSGVALEGRATALGGQLPCPSLFSRNLYPRFCPVLNRFGVSNLLQTVKSNPSCKKQLIQSRPVDFLGHPFFLSRSRVE